MTRNPLEQRWPIAVDARRYPAFRSQSLNVSKHVAVLSELARLVDVYHLLDVSQFEQELACADEHVLHYRELMEKLSSSRCQQILIRFMLPLIQ